MALEHEDGDPCPEDIDGDPCHHKLTLRTHERNPQFDTEPAAPVKELICPIHGVVEKV